ncbi:MAG: phenylalanine--tRNA ligase subunit beta, partial [Ruminococcus sp.]
NPDAQVVSALTDEYPVKYDTVTLSFDKKFVDRYTGIEIANDAIVKTLTDLGFEVTLEGDNFTVVVPSWRATKDVTIKADIIEEITRIYGYDNFDINTAKAPLYPVRAEAVKTNEDRIKDILVKAFKLHELHSYVWAYNDELKDLGIEIEENVRLANATNPNIETLRNSIIPTQLCQVKSNSGFAPDFGIFEIGRVIKGLDEKKLCIEKKNLAITLFSKTKDIKTLYLELRDILGVLARDIKHTEFSFKAKETTHAYEHPVNLYALSIDGKDIGTMGIVHPSVMKKIDKKANVVFAELDMDAFTEAKTDALTYDEPSKFPAITYDLSVELPAGLFFDALSSAWKEEGKEILKSVKIVDTYDTDTVHSITVRFEFSSSERTLSGEEIGAIMDKVMANMETLGVTLRTQ